MLIKLGYELVFDIPAPSVPMLVMLYVHPDHAHVLQQPERIIVEPSTVQLTDFIDSFGNRSARLVAPQGKLRLTYDNIATDSGQPEPTIEGQTLHAVEDLPPEVLPFLMASRYCEV